MFATPALSNGKCPPELHRAWSRLKTAAENASDAVNFQHLVDTGMISDSDLDLFHFVETAEQAWDKLAEHYGFAAAGATAA